MPARIDIAADIALRVEADQPGQAFLCCPDAPAHLFRLGRNLLERCRGLANHRPIDRRDRLSIFRPGDPDRQREVIGFASASRSSAISCAEQGQAPRNSARSSSSAGASSRDLRTKADCGKVVGRRRRQEVERAQTALLCRFALCIDERARDAATRAALRPLRPSAASRPCREAPIRPSRPLRRRSARAESRRGTLGLPRGVAHWPRAVPTRRTSRRALRGRIRISMGLICISFSCNRGVEARRSS